MKTIRTGKPPYIPHDRYIFMLIADYVVEDSREKVFIIDSLGIMGAGSLTGITAHHPLFEIGRQTMQPVVMPIYARPELPEITVYDETPIPKKDRNKIVQPILSNQPKYARNEPCYCGSGKKYKRCHGLNP